RLAATSGNNRFDESVVRAVQKASPVPPAPDRLYHQFKEVRITVESDKWLQQNRTIASTTRFSLRELEKGVKNKSEHAQNTNRCVRRLANGIVWHATFVIELNQRLMLNKKFLKLTVLFPLLLVVGLFPNQVSAQTDLRIRG